MVGLLIVPCLIGIFKFVVPAKIASFDDTFIATYKEDVKLPCVAVGVPQPDITWKVKGNAFTQNDRMRLLPEGSLFIKEVTRVDAGDYTCNVENSFGHDTVTHKLVVHGMLDFSISQVVSSPIAT